MYRGSKPRILPIIIIIIVIALVVAALVAAGRMIFGGEPSEPTNQNTNSLSTALLDTTAERAVRWTVRGPIVGNENFKTYQITIAPNGRTYTIYNNYLDQVSKNMTYDNNLPAYEQFIYALDNAGITNVRTVKDTDIRGVCATDGIAYTFETLSSGNADNTIWSSTCKDSPGTMAADPLKIQALFVNQIPDFMPLFGKIY